MAFNQLQVGAVSKASGQVNQQGGFQADGIISELHGRFYTQTYQGNVYSTGMQLTSINAVTFTTADALSGTLATAAQSTPIVGIWNASSPSSGINAVIWQATLGIVETSLTATGCGGFVWVAYTGNTTNNITVGSQAVPVNRKSLTAAGSQVKGLSGLALTGLASTGTLLAASALDGGSVYNVSEVATAVGFHTQMAAVTENLDGNIIVPPGGILGLFCSTTPVAHSAISSIVWEEVSL
jgi:hypothetical protein